MPESITEMSEKCTFVMGIASLSPASRAFELMRVDADHPMKYAIRNGLASASRSSCRPLSTCLACISGGFISS